MSTTEGGGAYGAGMAGGSFDPLVFIKKPQVILRIGSTVRIHFQFSNNDLSIFMKQV